MTGHGPIVVGRHVALGSTITRVLLDEYGADPIWLSDDDPPDELLDREHLVFVCGACLREEHPEAAGVLEAARQELPQA